jgi:hypothetical protein
LRLTRGRIRAAETEVPCQPAALMILIRVLHGAGHVLRRVIFRIVAIAGAALQLPSQLPALFRLNCREASVAAL